MRSKRNDPEVQLQLNFNSRERRSDLNHLSRSAEDLYSYLRGIDGGERLLPSDGFWVVQIGYTQLSERCRVSSRTLTRVFQELITKNLVKRASAPSHTDAFVYHVFPCNQLHRP